MNNILSLLLGLCAWVLGIAAIACKKRYFLSSCSFTLCCCALVFQFAELRRLEAIKDYSAILDTVNAIFLAAMLLTAVTVILNTIALLRRN